MSSLSGETRISLKNENVFLNRASSSCRTGLMIFAAFGMLIAFLAGSVLTASGNQLCLSYAPDPDQGNICASVKTIRDDSGNLMLSIGVDCPAGAGEGWIDLEFNQQPLATIEGSLGRIQGVRSLDDLLVRLKLDAAGVLSSVEVFVFAYAPGKKMDEYILIKTASGEESDEVVHALMRKRDAISESAIEMEGSNDLINVDINVSNLLGNDVTFTTIRAQTAGDSALGQIDIISLPGSDFEIDSNANLILNDTAGEFLYDWANVDEKRSNEEFTGSGDNSFQGSKEDTQVPTLDFGSIPPNKSDLKTFGIFDESKGDRKFVHMFWTRVQDPSGTTNMDFEFNKNKCDPDDPAGSMCSENGVTPVRTPDDMLVVYELTKGGTVPELFLSKWTDATNGSGKPSDDCEASKSYPCWGKLENLTDSEKAIGSINSLLIPEEESDNLGPLDPRTFGEASIDLTFIFDPEKCESFGSAYLKSRSSDSFTSALKDFIAPITSTITNCGTVTIRKQTNPDGTEGTFRYTNNLATDPPNDSLEFNLSDNGVKSFDGIVLSGKGYNVTEDDPTPLGFDLTEIDCSESSEGFPIDINVENRSITFDMTVGGTVDCTFINTKRGRIIIDKVTVPGGDTQLFDFLLTGGPDEISKPCKLADATPPCDSGYIKQGQYSVVETPLEGWDLTSAVCDDGSNPGEIGLEPGDTVTCTFTNIKRGRIIIDKKTVPAGHPQEFDLLLTGGPDGISKQCKLADATPPCNSGYIKPGQYSVVETPLDCWDLTSAVCSDGSLPGAIGLGPGETVTCEFTNTKRGRIIIDKKTVPSGHPQKFHFLLTGGPDGIIKECDLADADDPCDSGCIKPGEYSVVETVPEGWNLASAVCSDGSPPNAISLQANETVTCTFTNSTGAIRVFKKAKNAALGPGDHPHAGVEFEISKDGGLIDTVTTDPNGMACIDGLEVGEAYTVTEIVPEGYEASSPNPQYVTVTEGTCSIGEPAKVIFSNTPLSELEFSFTSLAGEGVTEATIQCQNIDGTPIDLKEGVPRVLTDLPPGSYTCTIVIDP